MLKATIRRAMLRDMGFHSFESWRAV
jgi:hypothetical protein